VPLIVGSDAPARSVPFGDFAHSIALHVRAGVPALEAIRQATGLAARHAGFGDTTGVLRAGMAADIIAVPGDPSADIERLADIAFVMQGGTLLRTASHPTA